MDRLYADSILKSFGTNQVLTDVYISCEPGEIIGLIGRNGSGKSTLLKILFGSLRAEQKFVKVDNIQIRTLAEGLAFLKYLPQDNFLPKNILISTIIKLYDGIIEANEFQNDPLISNIIGSKAAELSSGQKRLVEILLILYSKARYLLLDEPFNGVAPIFKENIKDLIRKKSEHKGIIITDHDYRNVLDVSTKIILIHDGGTREIKNVEDLEYWGYLPENK